MGCAFAGSQRCRNVFRAQAVTGGEFVVVVEDHGGPLVGEQFLGGGGVLDHRAIGREIAEETQQANDLRERMIEAWPEDANLLDDLVEEVIGLVETWRPTTE